MPQSLDLELIRLDGGTQPRLGIDWETVREYADQMADGAAFPPVVVFYDGESYWLADGFHRYHAAVSQNTSEISAEVIQGTIEDAQWHSFGANKAHGLMRSNEDKQRAVKAALRHPKCAGLSDRAIAKHVGVTAPTVAAWRSKMDDPTVKVLQSRTGADGRTINTANIGRSHQPPPIPPVVEKAMASYIAANTAPPAPEPPARTLPKLEKAPEFLRITEREQDWQVDLKDCLKFISSSAFDVHRAVALAKDFGVEAEELREAAQFFNQLEVAYGANC